MSARVAIISGSVGAGHDGAADELERRLRQRGHTVTRHDFIALLGRRTGALIRSTYAAELSRAPRTWGWFLAAVQRSRFLYALVRLVAYRLAAARTLAALHPTPDLVISTYPVASQVLGRLRTRGRLAAPVATFLTDMSVHPLWIAPGVDAHLALHEVAAAQARAAGAAGVRVAGAAVRPRFQPLPDPGERTTVRARHAIPADRPAALVVAGSWGVGDILATAADVAATGVATPVVLCASNTALRDALRDRDLGVALGWVDDLAPLIRSCDVVIQNAGGLTSLEALACGVPVLSYRCLPGHGTSNAAALRDAGLAPWPGDPAALADALRVALHAPRPAVPPLVLADPTEALPGLPASEALPGMPASEALPGLPASEALPGMPASEALPGMPASEPLPARGALSASEALGDLPAAAAADVVVAA
jgi:UDP-N-acetylglucosamine:LPS N-acetylglucosamine transferase